MQNSVSPQSLVMQRATSVVQWILLLLPPSHSIEIEAYMAFGGLCPRRIFEALPSTRSGHPDAAPKGQIATLRQL